MSKNNLPVLTAEDRRRALEKAVESRREIARAKDRLSTGEVDPADVLRDVAPPLDRCRMYAFLRSCPHIGPAYARMICRELGFSETRRLGGLGRRQRETLISVFAAIAAGEGVPSAIRKAQDN